MVNEAMTILESPIARSEYNHSFNSRLEKHAKDYNRKTRRANLGSQLAQKTMLKAKQHASMASKESKTKDTEPKTAETSKTSQESKPKEAETKKSEASKASKESKPNAAEAEKSEANEDSKDSVKHASKVWDVAGYQVRTFKNWISVRIHSSAIRKFVYKEWDNQATTKNIAVEFAKQVNRKVLEFKYAKNKVDKIKFMNTSGIDSLKGNETVSMLQEILEQAGFCLNMLCPHLCTYHA